MSALPAVPSMTVTNRTMSILNDRGTAHAFSSFMETTTQASQIAAQPNDKNHAIRCYDQYGNYHDISVTERADGSWTVAVKYFEKAGASATPSRVQVSESSPGAGQLDFISGAQGGSFRLSWENGQLNQGDFDNWAQYDNPNLPIPTDGDYTASTLADVSFSETRAAFYSVQLTRMTSESWWAFLLGAA